MVAANRAARAPARGAAHSRLCAAATHERSTQLCRRTAPTRIWAAQSAGHQFLVRPAVLRCSAQPHRAGAPAAPRAKRGKNSIRKPYIWEYHGLSFAARTSQLSAECISRGMSYSRAIAQMDAMLS
jgi:hypothetical protein